MKVYQLEILELALYLEPVFKSKEGALYYKSKYQNRNIVIRERQIDELDDNYVYRIKNIDPEGYSLEDGIYSSYEHAKNNLKQSSQEIVKETLYI